MFRDSKGRLERVIGPGLDGTYGTVYARLVENSAYDHIGNRRTSAINRTDNETGSFIDKREEWRYGSVMPRSAREAPGGMVFHVLNRGVGRMRLFEKDGDYAAFERVLAETLELRPMRLCAYCVMPNHWHMVLWPREDGDLAAFMQRLTITHARRWQEHRRKVGTGHIYQGRYKSFPVQSDEYFLTVCRYVERNALRAGLTERAEAWRWGSLWRRGQSAEQSDMLLPQDRWPVKLPRNWVTSVNRAETAAELEVLRQCVVRGRPFGGSAWTARTVRRLGLENTLRPRGRPRKSAEERPT